MYAYKHLGSHIVQQRALGPLELELQKGCELCCIEQRPRLQAAERAARSLTCWAILRAPWFIPMASYILCLCGKYYSLISNTLKNMLERGGSLGISSVGSQEIPFSVRVTADRDKPSREMDHFSWFLMERKWITNKTHRYLICWLDWRQLRRYQNCQKDKYV